jgi:hypothetical protein
MSIYSEMYERVMNGERFHIDFEKRTMKVGGQIIIDGGEYDTSKVLYNEDYEHLDDILQKIGSLYAVYKHSLPSERSDNKRRKYFKALSVDELTDEQLIIGRTREVAQYLLEAFILCMIIKGDFVWDEEIMGKWFWQDEFDPDLVILKSWIE